MKAIPQSIIEQIKDPTPDIDGFMRLIRGQGRPEKMYLCELFADQEIMKWVTENVFGGIWVPISADKETQKKHLLCEINYWYRMGYDYIRVTGGCDFSKTAHSFLAADTSAELAKDKRYWADMTGGIVKTESDLERVDWPVVNDENLWMYEFVAKNLPDGMGILACPSSGFLEIPMEAIVGYEAMAMMSFENPALLMRVFEKVREIILAIYSKVVQIPQVAGFFQGDDMGYKTSTMMSPDFLKQYSLPGHKTAAQIAHKHDKIYLLHSCGYLFEIMDYLIDEVKIDGKQSYEDVIMPVEQFYKQYSGRTAVLGGLDIDILAAGDERLVRQRTRKILGECFHGGRYALGSGNTVTNYCRIENVLAMFDEAFMFMR